MAKREIVSVSLCIASDLRLCTYHSHPPSSNSKQSRIMLIKVKVGTPVRRALGLLRVSSGAGIRPKIPRIRNSDSLFTRIDPYWQRSTCYLIYIRAAERIFHLSDTSAMAGGAGTEVDLSVLCFLFHRSSWTSIQRTRCAGLHIHQIRGYNLNLFLPLRRYLDH